VRKFEAEVHVLVKSGREVVFPVRESSASASPCRDCAGSALSCRHFLLYVPNIQHRICVIQRSNASVIAPPLFCVPSTFRMVQSSGILNSDNLFLLASWGPRKNASASLSSGAFSPALRRQVFIQMGACIDLYLGTNQLFYLPPEPMLCSSRRP
jgi:hypothetical protein